MKEFEWKDVKSTFKAIATKLIKPYVVLPSKTRHGKLQPQQPSLFPQDDVPFYRQLLKTTKGVIDLPVETLIDSCIGTNPDRFNSPSNCELVLKLFLYNCKITIVSPETYYPGCAVRCPCEGCNEQLLFQKVNWDFPRFVLGLNRSNEVLFALTYKCKNGHICKTIDPQYLALLPTYVQKRYTYSSNDSLVVNSVCAWSLLIPDSLDPIYRALRLGRQCEHVERVEQYCLYVDMVAAKNPKSCFPSPPSQPYNTSSGSKLQSFLHPSEKLLREIRREAVKRFRPEIHASMQAVKPGRRIAIDSNYRNTKKTTSTANVLTAVLSKDGPDKGKVMGYAIHEGGESHKKSKELYKGIAERPGYKENLEQACIDTCCEGLKAESLMEHQVVKSFGLATSPKADIFHKIVGICDSTNDCALSPEHRRDVLNIFYTDVVSVEDMNRDYPDWSKHFEDVNLDGSMKNFSSEEEMPLDLYARKLIALARTFEKDLSSEWSLSLAPKQAQREWMLCQAIEYIGGKHCKYVPRRIRSKEDMLQQLDSYALKWFGFSIADMANAPSFSWDDPLVTQLTEASEMCPPFAVCNGRHFITLASPEDTDKSGFKDAMGTTWFPTTNSFFGKSLIFQVATDGKVLGKRSVIKAVLNLHQHIQKGCLDLHDGGYGLDCYSAVGDPVSKGDRKGLVAVESAFGQNELEAHFRVFNLTTAITTTLGDPELEPRLELSMLYQNHAVDVKHNLKTTPNPLYWRWDRINQIHLRTFKKPWYGFHTPGDPRKYKSEPFLGYGAYRFREAVLNRRTLSEAKTYALTGFVGSKSRSRWVFHADINYLSESTPGPVSTQVASAQPKVIAPSGKEKVQDAGKEEVQGAGKEEVQAEARKEEVRVAGKEKVQTEARKEEQQYDKVLVQDEAKMEEVLYEDKEVVQTDDKEDVQDDDREDEKDDTKKEELQAAGKRAIQQLPRSIDQSKRAQPKASLKRKRVAAEQRIPDRPPTKRLGNKKNLVSAYFKIAAPRSKKMKTLIRKSTSAVLAQAAESPRMEDLAEAVARKVNDEVYKLQGSPGEAINSFVNTQGVTNVLVDDAKKAAAKETLELHQPPKRKNAYKNVSIEQLFPVRRADLVKGIKHERAKRVLRHLKTWKESNCAVRRGLSTTIPKSK